MSIDAPRRPVLIAGATGRLGVIADMLLARGHAVRAMTRTVDSPAAERLRRIGAEVVYGDFEDPASIEHAADGVDAVFATGTAHKVGPDGELRHGRHLADAVAAAGVPQLVYSSGDGAAPDSPLPLFRAKFAVEEHIRSLPLGHTILAPVYFMENLFNPWNLPALRAGVLPSPIPIETPLAQVAIADLAQLAALVIERPEDFVRQRITVASDRLTAAKAANILSDVLGRELEAESLPLAELPLGLQAMFGWLERHCHDVDIRALHSRYPEVGWHTYRAWARAERRRFRNLCRREHAGVG